MEEKISIFRKIDSFLFTQIDLLKKNSQYQTVQETFQNLEEEQQKIVKLGLTIVIIVIPLLVISIFWATNRSLLSDIALRKQIIDRAQEIIKEQKRTESLSENLLATQPIDSQESMGQVILSYLAGSGIDLAKFKINNFNNETVGTGMNRTEANLKFQALTNEQLMNLFINLINRGKMKISSVDISRNNESGMLDGDIHIIQFSQALSEEE